LILIRCGRRSANSLRGRNRSKCRCRRTRLDCAGISPKATAALGQGQRVAFYELVTSSLKAADTLSSACPAEAALTPVGRMETMRKRLTAVRAATSAIRPALARFYEALDQGQKVRFAGMS
jgi:LTXXQ motif family protein